MPPAEDVIIITAPESKDEEQRCFSELSGLEIRKFRRPIMCWIVDKLSCMPSTLSLKFGRVAVVEREGKEPCLAVIAIAAEPAPQIEQEARAEVSRLLKDCAVSELVRFLAKPHRITGGSEKAGNAISEVPTSAANASEPSSTAVGDDSISILGTFPLETVGVWPIEPMLFTDNWDAEYLLINKMIQSTTELNALTIAILRFLADKIALKLDLRSRSMGLTATMVDAGWRGTYPVLLALEFSESEHYFELGPIIEEEASRQLREQKISALVGFLSTYRADA